MQFNLRYHAITLLLIFPIASLSLENNAFRVALNHVDSKSNFTKIELTNRAAARTKHRLSQLTGMQLFSTENISSTVRSDNGEDVPEYFMDLAIGNPPLHYSAILDTGSDLIWTQCSPCENCGSQPTPIYDPSKSSTVSSVPCNSTLYRSLCNATAGNTPPACLCSYNYTYGTGWTSGTLKEETFTFGTTELVTVPNIVFGCSASNIGNNGSAGLVGFGRGSFSLPSQLNASMFSYCFTSFLDTNSTSTLFVGPSAAFNGTAVKSTPFVKNPSMTPFYYLSLQGISLGNTKLPIDPSNFMLQSNGTGGLVIDSGSTFTTLVNEAYQAVESAIDAIIELQLVNASDSDLDLCYYLPSNSSVPTLPDMTLHFEGADMVLPAQNYMIQYQDDQQFCLAMMSSNLGFSILGNYQQQNFHILYDVDKEVLSFSPTQCDNL